MDCRRSGGGGIEGYFGVPVLHAIDEIIKSTFQTNFDRLDLPNAFLIWRKSLVRACVGRMKCVLLGPECVCAANGLSSIGFCAFFLLLPSLFNPAQSDKVINLTHQIISLSVKIHILLFIFFFSNLFILCIGAAMCGSVNDNGKRHNVNCVNHYYCPPPSPRTKPHKRWASALDGGGKMQTALTHAMPSYIINHLHFASFFDAFLHSFFCLFVAFFAYRQCLNESPFESIQ